MNPRPESCPNCGADVPANANACPECGADEKTGWSDEAHVGGLNLPDEPFDYDDFVEREFSSKIAPPRGIQWYWWLVAAALVALFVAGLIAFR